MANDVSNGNAASKANKITVVLGAQWGDEGKGKLVDLVAKDFDVIARCQGGNNAGHTVVVGDKAYDFHLLPSGIIWEGKVSLIGNGVVVHVPQLFEELEKNEAKGLSGWEERLKISDKAHLVFDFHQASDGFQEEERTRNSAGGKGGVTTEMLGTTKKGIGPAYSSKANRNGLRVSDLVGDFEEFTRKFGILADCYMARYPALKVDKEAEMARYKKYAERIRPMVAETISYIHDNVAEGKTVLVEGANASMLDIDFGTYPFVTSSNCSIGGVCTGLGVPPGFIGDVFGVVKAYTTRVGVGPFMTELTDDLGAFLQSHGKEFGVTTGRARRCGWLDIPLLRYTSMINGYTAVAMTKLDILDELDEIKIGVKYIKNGEPMKHFPSAVQDFDNVTVEYVTLPGWKTGIADCRSFAALPEKAQSYVKEVERLLGVPVRWIGVGQARDAVIDRQREES